MAISRVLSDTLSFPLDRLLYVVKAYRIAGVFEAEWECVRCAVVTPIDGNSPTSEVALACGKAAAELHHTDNH